MLPINALKMRNPTVAGGYLGPLNITRTDEGPSPFQVFLFGGKFTADASFSLTKLHCKIGDDPFTGTIRLLLYAINGDDSGGALLDYAEVTGTFAALSTPVVTLASPIAITAGDKYWPCAQADVAGLKMATSSDSIQYSLLEFWDGSPPATAAGYANDGTVRCSFVWGT